MADTVTLPKSQACRIRVYRAGGEVVTFGELEQLADDVSREDFVWLNLIAPSAADLAVVQARFGLHPLAVEDAALKHERPKVDHFEGYRLVIAHAVRLTIEHTLVVEEIAIFCGARFAVTIRTSSLLNLDDVERRFDATSGRDGDTFLYVALDTLVDAFAPIAQRYESQIGQLESRLFEFDARERTEHDIFRLKREMTLFRSSVSPMREMLAALLHGDRLLPPVLATYYRDVQDHAVYTIERIDVMRDLLNSSLDVHFSSLAHRQAAISNQLTMIATIFLPLTYLTGFFGQNFGWMVDHVKGAADFWWWSVGLQAATAVGFMWYFTVKRWTS